MFTMLRGPWPRVTPQGSDLAELEAAVAAGADPAELAAAREQVLADTLRAQVEAGMDLLTDGHVRWADPARALLSAFEAGDGGPDGLLARAWSAAASLADRPVAQAIPGPFALARAEAGAQGDVTDLRDRALAHADSLAGEITVLRELGCPVVIVEEPATVEAGRDRAARDAWVRVHGRLLRDALDLHLMLAVSGGSAHQLGGDVVFGLPYSSLLLDLIAGPDNWYLARQAPPDRGIVCAALDARPGSHPRDQVPQLVWAAQYAASMGGRGPDRVGVANASSLASLSPAEARAALDTLVLAARFAVMTGEEAIAAGFPEQAWRTMPGSSRPAGGR